MLLIYGLPSPILVDHAIMHIGYKLFAIWSLRRPTIHKMLTLIAVKNESLYTLPYSANINYFVIYIIIIIMAIIIQIFHANTHTHTHLYTGGVVMIERCGLHAANINSFGSQTSSKTRNYIVLTSHTTPQSDQIQRPKVEFVCAWR